jgi:tripartite-type tricarboxylate transporter receptor subunit TctC
MLRLIAAAAAVAGALAPGPGRAQDYPVRPVRVIASQGAGGLSDIFMRALGEELAKSLGQPFVVENRTGANGSIGGRACGEAPPDGYTICILPSDALSYNQLTLKTPGYDAATALTPITNLFFLTQVLAVSAALKANTLDDLAGLSKRQPGTLSYTAAGLSLVVFFERFKKETGADLVRVPFKGGGDAINGMLTGTTPVALFGLGNFLPHLRSGTVVGLAVDSERRSPLFPDIPTLRELGYRGDITPAFFGLMAPAGTPKAIVDRLQREVARLASQPAFRSRNMLERALEPVLDTPEAFAAFLAQDRAKAARIVKEAGLQGD